jgi:hypothetical protein
VQIRLPAGIVQILCRIVWTKDVGHGFFNSGLQFLQRFGRSSKPVSGVGCQVSDAELTPDS